MNILSLPEHPSRANYFVASKLLFLVKQGLDLVEKEDIVEFANIYAQIFQQSSSDRGELESIFESLFQEYESCQRKQYKLHDIYLQFTKVYEEHQEEVASFRKKLFSLLSDVKKCYGSDSIHDPHLLSPLQAHRSVDENSAEGPQKDTSLPELFITCFSHFTVKRLDQGIGLCSNRSGQMILRYLITQPNYSASTEKLITLGWPEDEPEIARNKLHLAISALRRSLHAGLPSVTGGGYLLYKNHRYFLNPAVPMRTDVQEFLYYYHSGQKKAEERIYFYERACSLYHGPFLQEDFYSDWSFVMREKFKNIYILMCKTLSTLYSQIQDYESAIHWATTVLVQDTSDEEAHQQIIQSYVSQGYRSKAIQQYHYCEQILRQELGVQPLPATTQLLQNLLEDHNTP